MVKNERLLNINQTSETKMKFKKKDWQTKFNKTEIIDFTFETFAISNAKIHKKYAMKEQFVVNYLCL